ncbi:TolC family protein [Pararcticibacter amylolyticus]|uniref:TolC family protein n=1 Tax=Pararcticibacter amylolyticus TaxID=2173175 RepID=A0A2U2PCY4_9SPHI|nr:TolC family protein [Pararcticibacter amylolyticus]
MKSIFFLMICFLVPYCLSAQTRWDLKSCIEYGLKNNRNTTVYENEKKAADARAREALAAYLPSINATGTVDNNLKVQETVIPAGIFGPEDTRVAFSKKYSTNGTAQLDQVIFDQSLLTGLKASKYNRQQADLNGQMNEEAIIYNVSNAFYQIFVYREQLNFIRSVQETYRRQIDINSLKVKKGVILQKELDKILVDYNNSLSQLRVAESNLALSENQLKYEMGYPFEQPLPLDSAAASYSGIVTATAVIDSSFSPGNRVEYRLSEVNLKLLEIDESRIKAGALPKLSGYFRYGANGFGDDLGPTFRDMSSFSATGIKLTIPVFDFFKRNAQASQAKYKKLNAQEALELDKGKYRLQFENARTKLTEAQLNVENDRRNIDLAHSVFETTDLQYQKGVTDLTDWLNAQNSLKEAHNNFLNSLYKLFVTKVDFDKAAGTLKTSYTLYR